MTPAVETLAQSYDLPARLHVDARLIHPLDLSAPLAPNEVPMPRLARVFGSLEHLLHRSKYLTPNEHQRGALRWYQLSATSITW